MTAAQSFIRTDLNDAQRVTRLRAAAVLEEERTVQRGMDHAGRQPGRARLRRWRRRLRHAAERAGPDRAHHQGRPADRGGTTATASAARAAPTG